MTDDRSLVRAARSWLEEGPTRAPDRPVEAAIARIQNVQQERDLRIPWRSSTMNPIARLTAGAVLAVLAVGVVVFAFRPLPNVAAPATPVPSPPSRPEPSMTAAAIPPGTYRAATISVADTLADLNDESGLTAEEKTAIIDELLSIRDAEVLDIELVISTNELVFRQGTDGGSMYTNPAWQLFAIDENTIAIRGPSDGQLLGYDVIWNDESFALRPVSPSPGGVGGFALKIMLESESFTLVP